MKIYRSDLERLGLIVYSDPEDHITSEDIILVCGHAVYRALCEVCPSLETTRVLYVNQINEYHLAKFFHTT